MGLGAGLIFKGFGFYETTISEPVRRKRKAVANPVPRIHLHPNQRVRKKKSPPPTPNEKRILPPKKEKASS